jgi:hypothetical protein
MIFTPGVYGRVAHLADIRDRRYLLAVTAAMGKDFDGIIVKDGALLGLLVWLEPLAWVTDCWCSYLSGLGRSRSLGQLPAMPCPGLTPGGPSLWRHAPPTGAALAHVRS